MPVPMPMPTSIPPSLPPSLPASTLFALCSTPKFGQEDVRKFCFYVFDSDKNGTIEDDELNNLVDVLHDSKINGNVSKALKQADQNGDGNIDFEEFAELDRRFDCRRREGRVYACARVCGGGCGSVGGVVERVAQQQFWQQR